eukprot:11879749-Karenia_brevis.AAC.1
MTKKVEKTFKKYLIGEYLAMLGFGSLYHGPCTLILAQASIDEEDYMVEQCLKRIGALHGLSTNDESTLLWHVIHGIPHGPWPQ